MTCRIGVDQMFKTMGTTIRTSDMDIIKNGEVL